MTLSVNWATKVLSIPKTDTTLVEIGPPEIRQYDVYNTFWKEFKAAEAGETGIVFDDGEDHGTNRILSGIDFGHFVEIIAGYTCIFESGAYVINLFGANHNLLDVSNASNPSIRANLSAGLVQVANPLVDALTLGQFVSLK